MAFEVEVGTFEKHSIGSVLNLSKICGKGVLVVETKKADLAETIRVLSSNNVDTKDFFEIYSLR
ncbi:MAG: hypothetical protein H5T85_00655 [Actinobacteria bacterium]|nr:hypothetical protein [Actinomycetota bacterium]